MVFYIFFVVIVPVFLYAYYVYVMIYHRCWSILFKVLMLNVAFCIMILHLSSFCFSQSFVADVSKTGTRAPTSAKRAPFLPAWRAMQFEHVVWVRVMVIFRLLWFNLINRRNPKRWVAIVPRRNYLILAIDLWRFVHPASDKAHRWPINGFIRLISRLPCCSPWISWFSLWKQSLFPFLYFFSHFFVFRLFLFFF